MEPPTSEERQRELCRALRDACSFVYRVDVCGNNLHEDAYLDTMRFLGMIYVDGLISHIKRVRLHLDEVGTVSIVLAPSGQHDAVKLRVLDIAVQCYDSVILEHELTANGAPMYRSHWPFKTIPYPSLN